MLNDHARQSLGHMGKGWADDARESPSSFGRDAVDAFRTIMRGLCEHLPPVMLDVLIGEALAVRIAPLKDGHGGLWIATLEQLGTGLDRARKVIDHLERRHKPKREPADEVVAERLRKRFGLERPKPPVNVIPIDRARSTRKGPYAKT